MDKYLLEILKEINTIIIPGLGALTITNSDTGEIMFMSYLKHDDGKLAEHISQKEGMELNDAKNLIAKYVREILTELDKGEDYTMYKFGAFIKENDEIDFKNWSDIEHSKENIYIPPTPPVEKEKKEVPPKEEEPKKPIIQKEEPKEEKIVPPVSPPIPPKKEMPIDKKEELESTQEKLEQLKKKTEKKEKKKKGVGFWIGIVLLILLLGGGTYFGLNYDHLKNKIPFLAQEEKTYNIEDNVEEAKEELTIAEEELENNTDANETVDEESLTEEEDDLSTEEVTPDEAITTPIETAKNSEEIAEEVSKTTSQENYASGNYHIIAGAFSSEANANRLMDDLRNKGYSPQMKTGVKLHKVSIQSFSSSSDANTALKTIKNEYPNAWIDKW